VVSTMNDLLWGSKASVRLCLLGSGRIIWCCSVLCIRPSGCCSLSL
jgi:hypothetical protein